MATTDSYRFTVQKAADEFGFDRKTVAKRLKMAGLEGKADYSTREIYQALSGDLEAAEIRVANARAEKLEMEVAQLKGDLVPTDHVVIVWSNVLIAIRQIIKNSSVSKTEKLSLLKELREIPREELLSLETKT